GVIGAEVPHGGDELLGPAHPANRKRGCELVGRDALAVQKAPNHVARNVDRGEGQGIHADVVSRHLDGRRLGQRIHASLSSGIQAVRRATAVMSLVTEDILTIEPPPRTRMAAISCRIHDNRPFKLTAMSSSNTLSVESAIRPVASVPALFTAQSRPP